LIRAASLRARGEWGTTLVIASHDREWLYDICDEATHLFKGKIAGSGRSNMIFGPWSADASGHSYKLLDDGQRLMVSAPPTADATAFIDPAAIRMIAKGETVPGDSSASVQGTVIRLALERQHNHLFADVRIGSLILIVRVDESHPGAMTLHRGWPVTLSYRPESIRWR